MVTSTTTITGEGRLHPQLLHKPGLRPWQCAVGVLLALVVPYEAANALDVAAAPRAATWVAVAAVAGAVAVVLARRGGAVTRGLPEGRGRTLIDLSQLRGVR